MKEFSISNKRYFLLILSILYLLFNSMVHGLRWAMEKLSFLSTEGFDFMNAILILCVCMIYLVLIEYFSFYELRLLKWLSLTILILEFAHQIVRYLLPQLNDVGMNLINTSNLVIQVIWTILVLRQTKKEHTGSRMLKIYAWVSILAFCLCVLFFVVTIYFFPSKFYVNTFFLFLTMPYFVLLKFAGQIRANEVTVGP